MADLEVSTKAKGRKMGRWRYLRQYSLRTLLLFCTLVAVFMAWTTSKASRQRRAVAYLQQHGATVFYDGRENMHPFVAKLTSEESPVMRQRRSWLRELLGKDFFSTVTGVEVVDDLPDTDLRCFEALPQLNRLLLSDEHVNDDNVKSIASCRQLRRLWVDSTNISSTGLQQLCSLRKLELLDLSYGGRFGVNDLEQLCKLPELKSLGIPGNVVREEDLQPLKKKYPSILFYRN